MENIAYGNHCAQITNKIPQKPSLSKKGKQASVPVGVRRLILFDRFGNITAGLTRARVQKVQRAQMNTVMLLCYLNGAIPLAGILRTENKLGDYSARNSQFLLVYLEHAAEEVVALAFLIQLFGIVQHAYKHTDRQT